MPHLKRHPTRGTDLLGTTDPQSGRLSMKRLLISFSLTVLRHTDERSPGAAAVPVLKDKLSERCTVVLVDIDRQEEMEITKEWEVQIGVSFRFLHLHGNIAVGHRGQAFTVV